MEIRLTPEQEARLAEIADREGTTPEAMFADAALGLLNEDEHHRETIRERLRQADEGVFVSESEMDVRIARMLEVQ